MEQKEVLIIGAGFAGLKAAKTLGNRRGIHVTLVDRRNHHLFQPLLYQVATAGLSPAEIAVPVRSILRSYKNIDVFLGNVKNLKLRDRVVETDFGDLKYDALVVACGATHSYFGHDEWEDSAPGLKTLEQATEIRRRILLAYELAEREKDPELQKQNLTFAIIGAGPTGVELAGTLGEISRFSIKNEFDHIDPRRARIVLIEAGPRILPSFDESLAEHAVNDLEKLGVTVWTSTRVTDVSSEGVRMGDEFLKASTVLWAAGVKPSALNLAMGVPLDRVGRAIVEADLSLASYPEVFVLGDQACFKTKSGEILPGLAPVAMQQGVAAGKNIIHHFSQKPRLPFQYKDKGMMSTIGRKKAIVQMGRIKMTGGLAWIVWLVIHVYYLIGFKNRLMVLFQWTWSYVTFKRGARLILYKEWKSARSVP